MRSLKILFLFIVLLLNAPLLKANEPDSAYLFAYGDGIGSGLYFAWSIDQLSWHPIGHNHTFLRSDYGRWGSQKRMYDPFLLQAPDGRWFCTWSLNDQDGAIALTVSTDLIYWKPQSYPVLMPLGTDTTGTHFYVGGVRVTGIATNATGGAWLTELELHARDPQSGSKPGTAAVINGVGGDIIRWRGA